MKKTVLIILVLSMLLSLCACGASEPAAKDVDLSALYESFSSSLPDMMIMDETIRLNLLGINSEDCTEVITAVAAVGLQADEIWLIEAKDADALERITALAESRINAKKEETSFYSPDQFAICEDGRIITDGLYMAFIVSPSADSLQDTFKEALK